MAVLQTRDGYLWAATQGGLARFDGVQFFNFRTANTPAFLNHSIRFLHEDHDGALWIGTDRGVVRHHAGNFRHMGLAEAVVTSLAMDREGTLWAGTYGQGLFAFRDGQWRQHARAAEIGSAFVICLFVDAADRLWIGCEGRNGVVCHERGVFRHYDGAGAIIDRVQTICELPRGTLWFGTRHHGLFRLKDDVLAHFTPANGLKNKGIAHVRPARGGGLWVANGALQRVVDLDRFTLETISRGPGDRFSAMCEDHEGSIWLCAAGESLIRARKMPFQLLPADVNSPTAEVRSVAEDADGNLWFVLRNRRIARLAPNEDVATPIPPPDPPREASVVQVTRDGKIWLASDELYVWREGRWEVQFPTLKSIYALHEDRDGALWIGTVGTGLYRAQNGTVTALTLPDGRPIPSTATSFAQAPDGTMYVGLWQGGLLAIKEGEVAWQTRASGLPGDEVRSVYVDKEGHVWAGIKGRGLALLENGRWLNPDVLSEAVSDNVTAIIEDDSGRLWLGTPAGVVCAPKDEFLATAHGQRTLSSIRLTSMNDGSHITPIFSGPQPIVWKTRDGRLVFASREGALAIDPERLPTNAAPPPVHIERILIDRQAAPTRDGFKVPAGTRDLAFEYTALSFVQPSRVFFKFKLEGYDRDWVDAGTRRAAFYSKLPPGHYIFRVQACNSDGVWNTSGAWIGIVQLPHFYQTRWFVLLAVVCTIVFVSSLHRWRTMSLRRENERLEQGIADRTRELALANDVILARSRELELANNAKSEFLETVSHEIRNPLTGLNGLLGLLQVEKLDARAHELAVSIQACARGLTHVFEQVLGHAKLEHGVGAPEVAAFSLRAIMTELADSFAWQASQQGNRIELRFAPDFVDGFAGDAGKIKTIASNFVANAIRYAPGSGIEIEVETHMADGENIEAYIEVRDHGPGIPPEEQELIFRKFVRGSAAQKDHVIGTGLGLATCRVLAAALKGNVGVESRPGRGATFYLCVPLRRAAMTDAMPLVDSHNSDGAGMALIVEDDRYNQIVLRGLALELGYGCELASNAAQAAACLERQQFDIIFLDWELPGLKGDDIARRVRARPGGDRPIIIATTAHDSAAIRGACADAGMDDFLPKPYDAAQVRRCLRNVRARRSGQAVVDSGGTETCEPQSSSRRAFELHARGTAGTAEESAAAFVQDLQRELKKLEVALDENDFEGLAQGAHRLRGLAGLVGDRELSAAARELERVLRQGSREEQRAAFRAIVAAAASHAA